MNHIWKAIFGSRILHVGIKEKQLLIENCLMWKDSQVLENFYFVCLNYFFFHVFISMEYTAYNCSSNQH